VSLDPAEARLPQPVRVAAAALSVLASAYSLAVFTVLQYAPAHLVTERARALTRPDGMLFDLLEVLPFALALTISGWLYLGFRGRPRDRVEALVAAGRAIWPLALIATTLWFDHIPGRQVLAAALLGLVAWRVFPLLDIGEGHLHGRLPPLLRGVAPDSLAAILCLGVGGFLLFGAWSRHDAHWSSLIDLGLFYELYDNARGELLWAPTIGQSFLGEHFSPVLVLLAPVMSLFPSPATLLVIQSLAITGGAWLLYLLARDRTRSAPLAVVLMLAYQLSPWVQAAAFYDFHMDMLEPPMLFGLALALHRRRAAWVWICALLLWCTKEDTFIYTSVLGLWAALALRQRRLGLALVAAGLAQGALVLLVALPALRAPFDPTVFSTTGPTEGYAFLTRYNHLGDGFGAIIGNVLANPFYVVDHLTTGPRLTNVLALLLTFGALACFARVGLLLLIPTLEFLLANPGPTSDFAFYYGALAFMFAPLAAIEGARNLLERPPRLLGRGPGPRRIALGVGVITLFLVGWHPTSWLSDHHTYKPTVITPHHVQARSLIDRVPPHSRVSATGYHAVHLQPSRDVRMFPYGLDQADYVLVDLQRPPWPRSMVEVQEQLLRLPSQGFAVVAEGGGLFLLERDPAGPRPGDRQRLRAALDNLRIEPELSEQSAFINRVVRDEDASNEAFRRVGPSDRRGPGYLHYGPFVHLSPGEYVATFRLRWRDAGLFRRPADRVAVTLDVVTQAGSHPKARRDLRVGELRADARDWTEVQLSFTVRSRRHALELRTFYHDVGVLDLDVIRVERQEAP